MVLKIFSLLFLGVGVFVLMQVAMPVLAFKTWEVTSLDQAQLLADPRPRGFAGELGYSKVLGISVETINNFPTFIPSQSRLSAPPYSEFSISAPKIKLDKTRVLVDSSEFEENLGHLPGTALPGEKGNVFISGHSSISRALAKTQKAYLVNLPSIKKGDEIFIEALGQQYTYEVVGLKVVDPKDIAVIYPPDNDGRYLTLMTCVPPGFNTKRLVVLAKLTS